MQNFKNKVAVVTGAASGIGKAIALECARRNMRIVLADINLENLLQCEREFKQLKAISTAIVIDVSKEADIKKLAQLTLDTFGAVHLLFNHAGIPGPIGPIWETDISEFKRTLDCNLMSVVYGLKEFIPIMLNQNDECHIINTASGAGLHTGPNMSAYVTSKHAIVALSEVLHFDLWQRNKNIYVSLLCPGLVSTNFADSLKAKDTDEKEVRELVHFFKTAMREEGMHPVEIANLVFRAIEHKQFYILPHLKQHKKLIKHRMKNILKLRNPGM